MKNVWAFLLALMLVSGCADQPTAADRITIRDVGSTFELTVEKSLLVMTVPKGALVISSNQRGGATSSLRYFFLEDRGSGVILSGWFEASDHYASLADSWAHEMKKLKESGFGDPMNVRTSEVKRWKIISYDMPAGKESSSHIRASYVDAGTWIDLHASVSAVQPAAETQARVLALLNSIEVRRK